MQKKITSPSYFIGKSKPGLISFGSGQPDLPPPAKVYHTFDDHKNFKYGLVQGEEILRRAIATQYPNASAQQFVITNGASEALDLTLRCLRHNGRKILLPRPYYYSYPYNVQFAGLEPVFYDLEKGKINMHNFKKVLDGCSAVLINSPSNPTGSIQDIAVLQEIEKITQEKNIYVISDEVYKDLIYERENYLIKGPHVVTINSFSKTYSMCGYRIGYLFSTDIDFINDVIEMKTHTSMNTNILAQEMAYAATQVPVREVKQQIKIWEKRRDYIYNALKDIGLELWKPEGAFYVFPKVDNGNKVINELYYNYNIICYDGAWFGAPNRVRFSYALDLEKIKQGMEKVKLYFKQ